MSRRSLAVITTTALVITTAAGCGGADPSAATRPVVEPRYTALEVPAAMMPSGPTVEQVGLLGAADGAPWSVHAIRTVPGEPARAVVWAARDGALPPEPTELPVEGEASSLVVAGSGALSVAAVRTVVDGTESTRVLTSTDRRTWIDVDAPELAAIDVAAATVASDEAIVVGTDRATGEPVGVSLSAEGLVEELGMPASPDGITTSLELKAVAWHDGELALATSQDRSEDADVVSVYRSINRGQNWVEDPVDGDHVQVAGLAATEHGFVLTGHVSQTRDTRVLTRTGVWTAIGGRRGFEPVADPPTAGIEDNVWIGAPTASGAGYRVQISSPYSQSVGLATEDGSILAVSEPLGERGLFGPTTADDDGTLRTIAAGHHGATVLEVRPDPSGGVQLVPVASLAAFQHWFTPNGRNGSGVLEAGSRRVVDWGEGGWREYTQQHRYILDPAGDRLVEPPADGVEAAGDGWRFDASGPHGDLALVSAFEPGDVTSFRSVPWARDAGGEWQQGSLPGSTALGTTPVWVAGEWLLAGTTAPSLDVDDARTAAVWSSGDGVTWVPADGFPGAVGQAAHTVCPLGERDALVLGNDRDLSLVWARIGGTWQTVPLTADGRRDALDCNVAQDGRTVIRVAQGDDVRLLATADGVDTEEVLSTGDDAWIGTVRAVPGGYAAAGHVQDDDGQYRAALWVSTDGLDWRHLDGPAGEDGLSDLTVLDGTVVVMTGDDKGSRVWRVDEGVSHGRVVGG